MQIKSNLKCSPKKKKKTSCEFLINTLSDLTQYNIESLCYHPLYVNQLNLPLFQDVTLLSVGKP